MTATVDIIEEAQRYEAAYNEVFASLDGWKKAAVTEDQQAGVEGRILMEFIREVAKKAEISA